MKVRALRTGGMESRLALGNGILEHLDALLSDVPDKSCIVAVTDENVARCQGARLPPGLERIVLPPGESSKSLSTFSLLIQSLLDRGMDRKGLVIAFGGGVVGDISGFAAATFMRGIRWVNVPTTLLAMVDASIGGKTAVDMNGAKNLVGAFHPPEMVVADPQTLATLPDRERSSGMAEVIKHALIASQALFERLEAGKFGAVDDIEQAIHVKSEIVERDPFEHGERALLNLGHTVGHGIESASAYGLSHGEAVAIGLVAEAKISEAMGLAAHGLAERIASVARQFNLPTSCALQPEAVREAMSADKKRTSGRLRFALPKDVGEAVYGIEVEDSVVRGALREICRP